MTTEHVSHPLNWGHLYGIMSVESASALLASLQTRCKNLSPDMPAMVRIGPHIAEVGTSKMDSQLKVCI